MARRAKAGDLDAEGQLLRLRVRSGELTTINLRLAAYCGHLGALRALGLDPRSGCSWAYQPQEELDMGPIKVVELYFNKNRVLSWQTWVFGTYAFDRLVPLKTSVEFLREYLNLYPKGVNPDRDRERVSLANLDRWIAGDREGLTERGFYRRYRVLAPLNASIPWEILAEPLPETNIHGRVRLIGFVADLLQYKHVSTLRVKERIAEWSLM